MAPSGGCCLNGTKCLSFNYILTEMPLSSPQPPPVLLTWDFSVATLQGMEVVHELWHRNLEDLKESGVLKQPVGDLRQIDGQMDRQSVRRVDGRTQPSRH